MKALLLVVATAAAFAAEPTAAIKVDQAGYPVAARKVALVSSETPASEFVVRRVKDDSVAFRGVLSPQQADPDSGDRVQSAEFTGLTARGDYYVDVPGIGRSWGFAISPSVYSRAYYLAMRSYYGQRCGTAVDLGAEFPGYRHQACHLQGAWHESSGKAGPRASKGGWHDAGDYGRYVVNSGISTGTLLWTWEMFAPRIRGIKLNLPETGNGTPDILNEIRWNLDWMLSMQDDDGGVWHKQTSERFCGFVMPEQDTLISYVIGTGKTPFKSSCATGDFAAVTAIAASAYQPFDPVFAGKCLRAARLAFAWLEKFPDVIYHNPAGVSTGDYGDRDCGDEILWAAAELWRTTRENAYERYFLEHYGAFEKSIHPVGPQSWSNVANLALWSYVLGGGKNAQAASSIRQTSLDAADRVVERSAANAYRISLTPSDYIWGSNGVAANYAMQLVVADALEHKPAYLETALDNLHYLLGRNVFSLSFVTQVGAHPFRHPHHRPSGADNNAEPWPGLLSGGPNRGRQDSAMRRLPADLPPARMYLDDQAAYSANEIAINWNAPLVFLLAAALPER